MDFKEIKPVNPKENQSCIFKAMVSPVVMFRCKSWTIQKVECRRMMLLNCGIGEDS